MSEITSRPYQPKMACERCCFGRGEHAEWCEWEQLHIEEIQSEIPGVKAFAVTRPLPDGSREIVEWQYVAMPAEREYTLSIPIDYRKERE